MERYWMAKKALLNIPVIEGALPPDTFTQVVLYADAQRALDAEREKVKELKEWQRVVVGTGTDQEAVVRMAATEYTKTAVQCWKDENAKLTAQLSTLQAQLVRWKEALGEWLWNCTNLLGDYHIKTVQDFNEEVNRRIAWLMEHLDHTLPPPMTDEERDRMQKLSEGNAALQADNECKDSLIETLQAQLRQVEGERDQWIAANTKEPINEPVTYQALAGARFVAKRAFDELVKARSDLSALRQLVEVHTKQLTELTIIPIGCSREQELRWTQSIKDLRATLDATTPAGGQG